MFQEDDAVLVLKKMSNLLITEAIQNNKNGFIRLLLHVSDVNGKILVTIV